MKKGIFQIKSEELEERTVRFKISSEVVDRDGDILIAKGCDFSNFAKNPVFLPFHTYGDFPLGIPKNWGVEGKDVYCDVYFPTIEELATDPEQASEKAKLVDFTYHCYKTGMLNAVSVGFIAKELEPNKETNGYIIKEWELLEFSAVAVPANQDAIAQAVKSFGAEGKSIIDPIERIKDCENKLAECQKVIKEQNDKMALIKKDLDEIQIDGEDVQGEKDVLILDDEINLDEMKIEK
jgi:hypothetical protein